MLQRSHWYARGEYEYDDSFADSENAVCFNETDCKSPRDALDMPLSRKNWIDIEVSNETSFPKVREFKMHGL